jgi:hypothetical protein
VTTVLIVASNSVPPSYFRKVRQELGDGPDLVIDALVRSSPQEPVDDVVRRFEAIGPQAESGPDAAPSPSSAAVPETSESTSRARQVVGPVDAGSTDARTEPLTKAPTTGPTQIRAGVSRRVPRRVLAWLRRREEQAVSRAFWRRVRSSATAHELVRAADLVIVVDVGALRTGWHLSRRYPDRPVVFGLPAAAVQLEGGNRRRHHRACRRRSVGAAARHARRGL